MKDLRLRAAIVVVALLSSVTAQALRQQEATLQVASARLGEVKGEVTVRVPESEPVAARQGQVLSAGSVIETRKGSAVLELLDGSQVLVKSNSRVLVKAPDQGNPNFFELLIGKVIAKVQKRLENAPSFKMGTPTAVITVRGTRFSVEVEKSERTKVDVYEGAVEVASLGYENRPVLLRPGFGVEVQRGRMPERVRHMRHMDEAAGHGRENEAGEMPAGRDRGERDSAERSGDENRSSEDNRTPRLERREEEGASQRQSQQSSPPRDPD